MKKVALVLFTLAAAAMGLSKKGTNQHLWTDTEMTTTLWRMCSEGKVDELKAMIEDTPDVVHSRSSDGRGPLWWAFEHKQTSIIELLINSGISGDETDADGKKASEMSGPALTDYVKQLIEERRNQLDEADADIEEDDYMD